MPSLALATEARDSDDRCVIWGVADLIHDTFKRGKYQDIILPLTVLRRLDCVLADKKESVLKRQAQLKGTGARSRTIGTRAGASTT